MKFGVVIHKPTMNFGDDIQHRSEYHTPNSLSVCE